MVSGILALLTLTTGLNGPGYGPDKAAQRYRLDVTINQEVDLTAIGQGPQSSDVTGMVFLNVTMSDTTGGKLAHVVIDSMIVSATGQLAGQFTQDMADSLKGQWLHGYVVDGKLVGTAKPSVEGNPAMNVVTPAMNALFPGIGSKATDAETWADTTRSDVTDENGTRNSQQIVTWNVTNRDGETLVLSTSGTGSVTAADPQGQQISGTVTTSGSVTSAIGGPSSKASLTSTQELSVLNPALPEPIPVKVNSTATLTLLP